MKPATLVANLGTSDLTVKLDGFEYFFPVLFERKEPNLILPELGSDLAAAWEQSVNFTQEVLCSELDYQPENGKVSFREVTRRLLQAFTDQPEEWGDRIRPGRIWGVIEKAQSDFQVERVYLFVTNQSPPHHQDTVYLGEILKAWFGWKLGHALDIQLQPIPQTLLPVDQDDLFNYYYKFFRETAPASGKLLVSIKGGTPQMQNALRIQAITATTQVALFVEPRLAVADVLEGQPSACRIDSYWRSMRNQTYQSVELLLKSRWDFDGAISLLEFWKGTLDELVQDGIEIEAVKASQQQLGQIITGLNIGLECLNLDQTQAQSRLLNPSDPKLRPSINIDNLILEPHYSALLNLFTHCRIFWQLNRISDFVSRLASFYKETLCQLVQCLNGERFMERSRNQHQPLSWRLDKRTFMKANGGSLWQEFERLQLEEFSNASRQLAEETIPLQSRPIKSNFVRSLLLTTSREKQVHGQDVLVRLRKLDYWCLIRNDLIHGSEGISKTRLQKQLDEDRKNTRDARRREAAQAACNAEWSEFEFVFEQICFSPLNLIPANLSQRYARSDESYIYDPIRTWAIAQLEKESRQ
ncbi:MAG: hypothetical protein VKK04_04400 [Synechococcales bacterium]|nr:hypothetical protein [Synechococcales bacterium]